MAALAGVLLVAGGMAVYRFAGGAGTPEGSQANPNPAPMDSVRAIAKSPTATAPPAAAAPPAPSVAPAPAAAPSQIALTLRGAAPGAVVLLGDRTLGPANAPVMVPYGVEPVQLSVVAPGYEARTVTITPNAPLELALSPEKNKRRPNKRAQVSRDLEDPF